jgi:DMSO/TMAO reductase YedYZ molybdopterin-dependent catalytic subunit
MNLERHLREAGLSQSDVVNLERRLFLRTGLTLGTATLLSGCDVITNTGPVDGFLRMISRFNDGVQAALFNPNKLAPTFSEKLVPPVFRYNAQYPPEKIHKINPDTWRLEVSGLVADKSPWTLDRLKSMPQRADVTRHCCVEGWSMIGKWGGVPLRAFLEKVGADMTAKYVAFECDDPISYTGSIDLPSAMQPQTIMCLTYADKPLEPIFGAPMRMKIPTKLGYKQPKFVSAIRVTNEFPGGYWESYGYNWFGGL